MDFENDDDGIFDQMRDAATEYLKTADSKEDETNDNYARLYEHVEKRRIEYAKQQEELELRHNMANALQAKRSEFANDNKYIQHMEQEYISAKLSSATLTSRIEQLEADLKFAEEQIKAMRDKYVDAKSDLFTLKQRIMTSQEMLELHKRRFVEESPRSPFKANVFGDHTDELTGEDMSNVDNTKLFSANLLSYGCNEINVASADDLL